MRWKAHSEKAAKAFLLIMTGVKIGLVFWEITQEADPLKEEIELILYGYEINMEYKK